MAKKEEESKFINISSPSPASLIERNEIHEEREDTYSSFDSDFKVLEFGNISDPLIWIEIFFDRWFWNVLRKKRIGK